MSNPSTYKEWIAQQARDRSSRVVLALDLDGQSSQVLFRRGLKLLQETGDYLCAIRFGRQTLLNLGSRKTSQLIRRMHHFGLPCIIDDKLSDIGTTNTAITRAYYRLGFDAIIVNPSSGWEDGLEPVYQLSHDHGHGVIVLVYMSHPGAAETFGQRVLNGGRPLYQYEKYARKAVEWKSDGAVVGATGTRVIRKVNPTLKGLVPIYSPGIGIQGGSLELAKKAGADYFIIGRSITQAIDPRKTARKFSRESARA